MEDRNVSKRASKFSQRQGLCKSFWRLFMTLFKHDKELDDKIIHGLRTRAWLFFAASNCLRIVEIFSGAKGWFGDQVMCSEEVKTDCIKHYNKAFLDPIRPYTSNVMFVITFISIVLCILCYRWRSIADYFFTIENLMRFLAVLHLN